MNIAKLLSAVTVIAGLSAGAAQAAPLTYTFTGTVQGMPSEFSSLFSIGDTGQYVVTFDTSATDNCGGSAFCTDDSGLTFSSITVGSHLLASSNSGSYYVGPWFDNSSSILQPYTTGGFNSPAVLGWTPQSYQGNLWSTNSGIFASGVLPTNAFSLSAFNYLNGVYASWQRTIICTEADLYNVYGCYSVGDIANQMTSGQFALIFDSVVVNEGPVQTQSGVPAPGALTLLSLGLLGVGAARRMRKAA